MMGTPVLMYHAIADNHSSIPKDELPYTVATRSFLEQISYLRDHGITTRHIQEVNESPEHSVVITFDDGHRTDVLTALPLLLDHGQKAEFYVTTGWIGHRRYMNKSDIRELAEAGMTIGSHGVTHRYFDDMSVTDLRGELRDSKASLEDILGQEVCSGSVPGGRLHEQTESIAAELGYRYLCSSSVGIARLSEAMDFRLIPRLVVNRTTSLQDFACLVSQNQKTLLIRQVRARALNTAKAILGNRLYDRIRTTLLPGES